MSIFSLLVGIFMLSTVSEVYAQENLYDTILRNTRQEMLVAEDPEEVVGTYIQHIYPEGESEAAPENQDEFFSLLQGNMHEVCATGEHELLGCISPVIVTQKHTERMMKIREFGRNLQRIAAGYEMPVQGYPGQPLLTGWMLPGIADLWQAGHHGASSPDHNVRIEPIAEDDLGEEVIQAISGLQGEGAVAALWRYRHGVMQLGDCRQVESTGGELQHLTHRSCALEDLLRDLHRDVIDARREGAPPIQDGQTIVFPAITTPDFSGVIWVRSDDIGITPLLPIEPVLPSLDCTDSSGEDSACQDGVVLGGSYPPPPPPMNREVFVDLEDIPEEGRQPLTALCTHPLARRGYLCREPDLQDCEEQGDPDPSNPTLLLSRCRRPALRDAMPTKYSVLGPSICSPGGWRDDPVGQEEVPEECQTCTVDLACRATCRGLRHFSAADKEEDGTVEVCVQQGSTLIPFKLLAVAAKTLGQTQCTAPAGSPNASSIEQCCANDYQAYKALCETAEREGGFAESAYTVDQCIAAFSPLFCGDRGEGVCIDADLQEIGRLTVLRERMIDHMAISMGKGLETCSEVEESDPDIAQINASLPHPCSPGCRAAYKNTIGNNLCYAGQCIEKSVQEHRIVPGRSPLTAYDSLYPFDGCSEPLEPTLAAIAAPPERTTVIPPYRLQEFVQSLDRAFCQSTALPLLTPSILCNANADRRLAYAGDAWFTAIDLGAQKKERALSMDIITEHATSIASAVGTQLYLDYLKNAGLALGDLMALSNTLMTQIGNVQFSNVMCPRQWDSDVSLCEAIDNPDVEL